MLKLSMKSLNANVVFFLQVFFLKSHPVYDQTQGTGAVFS
jgi:hypothetical protein